jgi:hypothetical protein
LGVAAGKYAIFGVPDGENQAAERYPVKRGGGDSGKIPAHQGFSTDMKMICKRIQRRYRRVSERMIGR